MLLRLYHGIYKVLSKDPTIRSLLAIKQGELVAKRIQKRSEPVDIVNNMPIITFYAPPGGRDVTNFEVYNAPVHFDIYTSDNVDLAIDVAQRIIDLFDNSIPNFDGVGTFTSSLLTAHESRVDMQNVFCFTVIIQMSIEVKSSVC